MQPATKDVWRRYRKGDFPLKRRLFGNPVWLAVVMTAVLSWIQIDAAYFIQRSEQYRQLAIYAAVGALAVFFVLIAVYVALGRRGGLLFWGESSVVLGFTGVAAGANLLLNSAQQAWAFYMNGIAPPPYNTVFSSAEFGKIDTMFLHGTLVFGILGGLAILLFGLLWMFGGKVGSVFGQWMSLFPILWAFCRLGRYVQSYASTIRNAFSAAQAALLILSLLFFYMLGQQLNGRTKLTAVGLPACAFAFGMIGVSAFAARLFIQSYCPELVAGAIVVADVTDLIFGVFALAVGAVACSKKAAEKTAEYTEALTAAAVAEENDTTPTITLTQTPVATEPAVSTEEESATEDTLPEMPAPEMSETESALAEEPAVEETAAVESADEPNDENDDAE